MNITAVVSSSFTGCSILATLSNTMQNLVNMNKVVKIYSKLVPGHEWELELTKNSYINRQKAKSLTMNVATFECNQE